MLETYLFETGGASVARKESTESRMTVYRLMGLHNLEDGIRKKYSDAEGFESKPVTISDQPGLMIVGRTEEKGVGWAALLGGITGEAIGLRSSAAAAVLLIKDSNGQEKQTPYEDSEDAVANDHSSEGGSENSTAAPDCVDLSTFDAWAITFGMGFQLLEQYHVDHGFGQRVAVRAADPAGLNSISKTTLDERPLIERSTIASGGPLRNFGFEDLGDLATRVVADGEIEGLGQSGKSFKLRGSDSLSLPLSKKPDSLVDQLNIIQSVLQRKPASDDLAALEQLALIKDDDLISSLDGKLTEAIGKSDSPLLALSYPHELIDEYGSANAHQLKGGRSREKYDSLPTLDSILQHLRSVSDSNRLERLRRSSVLLFENMEDEQPASPKISLKKWLAFQADIDGDRYFLHNGRWFLMNRDYAETVRKRTRAIFKRGPYLEDLPDWELVELPDDEKLRKKLNAELQYNKKLADHLGGICLDQKLVRSEMHKRGIEACDVLLKDGTFIHVKHVDASAPASHLLAQAMVSTEVLTYDKSAIASLDSRISEMNGDPADYERKPARVVIIMARADRLLTADDLFTFTQVNLARNVAQLEQQGVEVHIAPILRRTRQVDHDDTP